MNGVIPGLHDMLEKLTVPFKDFKFEIMESHIKDKLKHKISIYYYSDPMIWIDTIDNTLLMADYKSITSLQQGESIGSYLIPLEKNISISFFQKMTSD
jgi:hypothetical protein